MDNEQRQTIKDLEALLQEIGRECKQVSISDDELKGIHFKWDIEQELKAKSKPTVSAHRKL